jgi:predicted NAD/FAD-dependent oxidoreductase
LIEPLCVSALNTPAHQASGAVFLRVLKDAVFGPQGSADLLLPRQDLGEIFPHAAIRWLEKHHAVCKMGVRVEQLTLNAAGPTRWQLAESSFDHVVLATPVWEAATLIAPLNPAWSAIATALVHEPIATVYVQANAAFQLPQPMMALKSNRNAPAQFVFDRGQMMTTRKTPGLLAFVISAAQDAKEALEVKVLQQAQDLMRTLNSELSASTDLKLVQTIIEKRATFACTPHLNRPSANPFAGLSVCGDYVAGPYPATLEGAVMSGCEAVRMIGDTHAFKEHLARSSVF